MPDLELHIAVTLGLLLGLSLMAGLLAEYLHLPKVTAYLMVGLLLGPGMMNQLPTEHVEQFDPMLKLAMALVLFGLGCHFPLQRIRRIAGRCLALSGGELLFTFGLVLVGLLAIGTRFNTAILLGCLALATAPATTVLVLKEYRSEGPVTECTGVLVALNNFASIVAFELVFLVMHLLQDGMDGSFIQQVIVVVRDVAGSITIGVVAGFAVSFGCGLVGRGRWIVLLVATTTLLLGVCESFAIPYMLTFLVMGVTLANTFDLSDKIVEELDHLTGLLCVLFFAVHGAELELGAFVRLGWIGAVYILCRVVGKVAGVYVAARVFKHSIELRQNLGSCLLAQAGAAIALSTIAVGRDEDLGRPVQTVILGSVVLFEIIGPLMIKYSLIRAGEVPLAQAIHHTQRTPLGQLRDISDRLVASLRKVDNVRPAPIDIKVKNLLRTNVGLNQSASFDEIIVHLEAQHDNTIPVYDNRRALVGLIRFQLVGNVMFDNTVNQLVRAEDLTSPANLVLNPEDSVATAFNQFKKTADDCIAVVEGDGSNVLLGVVRRADVRHLLIRQRNTAQAFEPW